MGTGDGEGTSRATEAAENAITSPLLEDVSIDGSTGILINVTASSNFSIDELNEACNHIRSRASSDVELIFGLVVDETMGDKVKKFEKLFANYIGVKYALMVNSGSSANLLALSVLTNPVVDEPIKKKSLVIPPDFDDMPTPKQDEKTKSPDNHWNEKIRAEYRAKEDLKIKEKD